MKEVFSSNTTPINGNFAISLELDSCKLKELYNFGIIPKNIFFRLAFIIDYGEDLSQLIDSVDSERKLIWTQENTRSFRSKWSQFSDSKIGLKRIDVTIEVICKTIADLIERLEIDVDSIEFDLQEPLKVEQLELLKNEYVS